MHGLRASLELAQTLLAIFDEQKINLLQGEVLGLGVAEGTFISKEFTREAFGLKDVPKEDERDECQIGACYRGSESATLSRHGRSLHMNTRYVCHLSCETGSAATSNH